jgi:hypothetical protein
MEALQRSGVSQRRCCAQHQLTEDGIPALAEGSDQRKSFAKAELLREELRELHVEAMTWAGIERASLCQSASLSLHTD